MKKLKKVSEKIAYIQKSTNVTEESSDMHTYSQKSNDLGNLGKSVEDKSEFLKLQ